MERFTGILGLAAIVGLCYLWSTNRRAIELRIVAWGMGLQLAFAFLVLKTPVRDALEFVSGAANQLFRYAGEGSKFVFGEKLGLRSQEFGVIFAFQVLPIVIFIASLFSILYYFGIMQVFVKGMAVAMQRVMGISGAEATNVAASIFMGQTEAPLTIKPFLPRMTESELFTIMTCGMAHVSGAVLGAYVSFLGEEMTKHLLTAVIMTAPATIMIAKMLVPETGTPETLGSVKIEVEKPGVNVIDAAARGAGDGLQLALNIGGMLIAFLSLIALVNGVFGWGHSLAGWFPSSLEGMLGSVLAPVAWLLGVPAKDTQAVGNLIGVRFIVNEFKAFIDLGTVKAQMDPRSYVIATYALCGFANLSSIAIQIGGIGGLAPGRKSDLARLGLKAVIAGTLANFMSACIAGMLI